MTVLELSAETYISGAGGQLNAQLGGLRPTQLPSEHCMASIVHMTSLGFGLASGLGAGLVSAAGFVLDLAQAVRQTSNTNRWLFISPAIVLLSAKIQIGRLILLAAK